MRWPGAGWARGRRGAFARSSAQRLLTSLSPLLFFSSSQSTFHDLTALAQGPAERARRAAAGADTRAAASKAAAEVRAADAAVAARAGGRAGAAAADARAAFAAALAELGEQADKDTGSCCSCCCYDCCCSPSEGAGDEDEEVEDAAALLDAALAEANLPPPPPPPTCRGCRALARRVAALESAIAAGAREAEGLTARLDGLAAAARASMASRPGGR